MLTQLADVGQPDRLKMFKDHLANKTNFTQIGQQNLWSSTSKIKQQEIVNSNGKFEKKNIFLGIGEDQHENENLQQITQEQENSLANQNLPSFNDICQENQSLPKKERKNKTQVIIQENKITTINKCQFEDLNFPLTFTEKSPICMNQLQNQETKNQQNSLHSFMSEDTLKKPFEYSHRQLETAVVTSTSTTTQSGKHEYEQKSKSVPNQHFDFYSAQFESKIIENSPSNQNNCKLYPTQMQKDILPAIIASQIPQSLGLGSFQKWLQLKNQNQQQKQLQQQQYPNPQYQSIQQNSSSPEQPHCFSARQNNDQQKQIIVIPKVSSIKKKSDFFVPQEGSYSTESFTPPQKGKQFYQLNSDIKTDVNNETEIQDNNKKNIVPGQMLFHSEASLHFSNPTTRREYLEDSNQIGVYYSENDQYSDRAQYKQDNRSSYHQSNYLFHHSQLQENHQDIGNLNESSRENKRISSRKLPKQRQLVDPVELMRSLAYYCPAKCLPERNNYQTQRSDIWQDSYFKNRNYYNSLDSARYLQKRSCSKTIGYHKKNSTIVEEKVEERLIRKGKIRDNKIIQLRVERDSQFNSLRFHPSSSKQRYDKNSYERNADIYGITDRGSAYKNKNQLNCSNLNIIRNSTPSNIGTSRARGDEQMTNLQAYEYFQGSNVQTKMSQKIFSSQRSDQRMHTAGASTPPPLRQRRGCHFHDFEKLPQSRENSLRYQFHPDILTSPRNSSTNRDTSRSSADSRSNKVVEFQFVPSPQQSYSWRDLQKRKKQSVDKLRQIKKALLVGADNIRKAAENINLISQRFECLYEQNQQVNNMIVECPRECRQFDQSQVFSSSRENNTDDRRDNPTELNQQYSEDWQVQLYLRETFYQQQQQQQQNQHFYSFNQQF